MVLVACAALAAFGAGCKKEKEPTFALSITAPDLPTVSSQLMCQAGNSVPLSTTGAESVRLTVLRETPSGELEFVCDRVIPVVPPDETARQPAIYAPLGEGELAVIVAETWKTGAAQQDAGVPHDAQNDLAPQADAQADGQHDASDAPVQADAQQDAQQDAQKDGQQDAQQDAVQTDAAPQTDAAAQHDAAHPTDAGSDGGTTSGVRLLASGRIRHVDLRGTEPRTIVIDQARGFSCALGVANVPRAFHTATVLPDGRVALIGGLSLGASASSLEIADRRKVYATARIEIFDPEAQTFTAATDPGLSAASTQVRAFHSAHLLASEGNIAKILLVGGVTSTDGTEFSPVVELDGTVVLDVAPLTEAKAASAEIVEIDLQSLTVTRSKPSPTPAARFMHGATEDPSARQLADPYPLIAGGASVGKGTNTLPSPVPTCEFAQPSGSKAGSPLLADTALTTGRLGATATDVGKQDLKKGAGLKQTWLVLGGNLFSAPASLQDESAEWVQVTQSDEAPTSATVDLLPLTGLPATAFHTATPLRDQDGRPSVLIVGGFVIQPSVLAPTQLAAFDPAAPGSGLPIISVMTELGKITPVPPPDGFKAVGFHDAVRLADKSVLISGGSPYNPQSSSLPNECPKTNECRPVPDACPGKVVQQDSRQCALCQAARFFPGDRSVVSEGNLRIARFGHRSTLLWDGRVLVTGGIHSRLKNQACSDGDILMMLTSAEIYNPQLVDPITEAVAPTRSADGGASATLAERKPGQTFDESFAGECCTCPSSIDEAKKLAKRCSSNAEKQCVWRLE